jgi:Tfp pilus assembly protein PilV
MSQIRRPSAKRSGMTLLEVTLSLTILAGTLIGLAEFGRRFAKSNGLAAIQNAATDLGGTRVERVKSERNYATIDTLAGYVTSVPGYTGYQMRTEVTRTNTAANDYKVITVTITHARLTTAVTKTTAIAAF